jgi:hypothetical protein
VPEFPELTLHPLSPSEWCVCDGGTTIEDPHGLICYVELIGTRCEVMWLRPAVESQSCDSMRDVLAESRSRLHSASRQS